MSYFNVQNFEENTVVEFTCRSLMDALDLEKIGEQLYQLVDEQDRRQIILDLEKIQFVSSQAIGIIMGLQKRLAALKKSRLILCGVNARLMELLKITRLDQLLTLKPSQMEAIRSLRGY